MKHYYSKAALEPTRICVTLSNILLYKNQFRLHMQSLFNRVKWLDCQTTPPRPVKNGKNTTSLHQLSDKLSEHDKMWDMTLVRHKNRELLVIATYEGKMMAVDIHSDRCKWQASEYIPNKRYPLRAMGVTADCNGHLFVRDWNNGCIHLYSFDGKFVKTLLEEGMHGLGKIRRIRWCENSSSLIVVHSGNGRQQYHISIFTGIA